MITLFTSRNQEENVRFNNLIKKFNVPYILCNRLSDKCMLEVKNETETKSFSYESFSSLTYPEMENVLGYKIICMKEAENIVFNSINYLNEKSLPIGEIKPGLVISRDIFSNVNNPSFRTSMRDGYGWNTNWKQTSLKLKDSIYAETEKTETFDEGETCYITTGGKVPDEFNTIIMIENVEEKVEQNSVIIKIKPEKPSFIRQIGSDMKEGELLLKKNTILSPYSIGLLLSARIKEIYIYDKPTVSIFSTGNELIPYFNYEEKGIVDINSPIIYNRLEAISYIETASILKDNLEDIIDALNEVESDIIITSGGASVGEHDFIKSALLTCGYTIHFCKINMMPGKPFTFATKENKYFFSLPGNPVASSVLTELFIVPFIKKLSGYIQYKNKMVKATIDFDVSINESDPRPDYQRVILLNNRIKSTGNQSSSTIKSMCDGNALICVDRKIKRNEIIDVIVLNENNLYDDRLKIGVLTASDRASKGIYEDLSGKKIMDFLKEQYPDNSIDIVYTVLPDEIEDIKKLLKQLCEEGCSLILTTGGSGPSIRDVTTLATLQIVDKELPGFGELMRNESLKVVPTAILSGQTAGIKYTNNKGTLIINLPGSPRSIYECLTAVWKAVPYCIELMGWEWIQTKDYWKPKK